MTASTMARFIGKKALLSVGIGDELIVEVWITDVKKQWGFVRYQVRPVAGFGRKWVEELTNPERPKNAWSTPSG